MYRGIIGGKGQIGSSLKRLYPDAAIKDLGVDEFTEELVVLHVAIPDSEEFIATINEVREEYSPELVIIHSTVALGTTEILNKEVSNCVSSPSRGVHPNLVDGLRTFIKYVGYDSEDTAMCAKEELEVGGMGVKLIQGSRNTEAAKFWSTSYYGVQLAFEKEIYKYCKENELDFGFVYGEWQRSYNKGYEALGMKNVIRPILKHMPGPYAGHCVDFNMCHMDGTETKKYFETVNEEK